MKTIVSAGLALVVIAAALLRDGWFPALQPEEDVRGLPPVALEGAPQGSRVRPGAAPADSAAVQRAFELEAQGLQLHVAGRVTRILPDDRDGSPHQRFIIATETGQTLLVAHNLDLAPRLEGLKSGDVVRVYGEYEWNPQGGVMHWTHDDPQGVHPAGYIEWQGRRYQ